MADKYNNLYQISYLGKHCSPLEVPGEFLQSTEISSMIRLPPMDMNEVKEKIKHKYSQFKKSEVLVSPGHIIDYYLTDKAEIRLTETLPAVQFRCPSMDVLEELTDELGLPFVYSAVSKPLLKSAQKLM
ncbi:hypothetical protein KA005_54590 [bacterium]|nr:hypothetical protein [bacterium]